MTQREIFEAALDIADLGQRNAYLDSACAGNADARKEIDELIAAQQKLGSFLDQPIGKPPVTVDYVPIAERVGTKIGPYVLREQIGEGGFGLVFVAEQIEPVKRKVALKVIKPGMDSAQVIARFEAERQALALMDHPNIAKVLDAGATESGRPYFVMELVRGIPITEYCDQNQLSPRERLDLFVTVCQAIQHAHQKGIIHRDIKPSNVLVTSHDGKPVAKVIDFGVAKAIHQQLTERTIYTNFAQMIGTPLYMSPEQAEMSGLDIDTRSDIYSLGVLLYELLTGTTPLEKKRFKEAAYDEIRRLIREEEPPKPSTRLSQSGESLPSVAAQRKMEPAKLSKLMRGDLDWITMKALEKDRTRRYETANGLARDIQRYLSDEAVEACPPSASYRLRKFARKNRAALLTASTIASLLVAGIAVSAWSAWQARQAERRATAERLRSEEAENEARRESERARKAEAEAREAAAAEKVAKEQAIAQKAKAEKAEAETLASYRASTDDALEQLIGSKPELGPQERAYLENLLKRWRAFANRAGDDERAQAIRGEGHYRVGLLWKNLNRLDDALRECEQASAIFEKLGADFPGDPSYRGAFAQIQNTLGNILAALGKAPEAALHYRQALAIDLKLTAEFPDVVEYRLDLSKNHNNLALFCSETGKPAEAVEHHRQALAILKKLAAEFPDVASYRRSLALSHNNLGNLLHHLNKRREAEEHYRQALAIQEAMVADFPAVAAYRRELAGSYHNLGNVFAEQGKRQGAEDQYRRAGIIHEKLAAEFPSVPKYRADLAGHQTSLGSLLGHQEKWSEAEEQFRRALPILEKLVTDFPTVRAYQIQLGGAYCDFAGMLSDRGRPDDSRAWFEKAIQTLTAVYDQDSRSAEAKQFLVMSHAGRALARDQMRQYADAVHDWDRAIELGPKEQQATFRIGRARSRLLAGQVAEAMAEIADLTKAAAPILDGSQNYNLACFFALASGKITDKKQEYGNRAMEWLQKAVKAGYTDAAQFKRDTDLESIREREDFKKLIAEMETAKP